MAKDSKWRSKKEPEIIDLASDDEDIEDASVVVIDLDETHCSSTEQKRKFQISEVVIIDDECVIDPNGKRNSVLDQVSKSVDNTSKETSLGIKVGNFTNLDETRDNILNTKGREILRPIPASLKTGGTVLECSADHIDEDSSAKNLVELNGLIYSNQNSSKSSSNSNNTGDVNKYSNKQNKKRNRGVEKDSKDLELVEILDDDLNDYIIIDDSIKIKSSSLISGTDVSDGDKSTDRIENVEPSKKKSKMSYQRPAHLFTPLTKPNPAIPSKNTIAVTNIYNPNAGSSEKRTGLRPIVIDGNNVALRHGKGSFSLKGLKICVNFFEKRGHRQIKVFIPHYRRNRTTHDELNKMEQDGLVVITPSRKVNGKVVASYDDRYIVQYAAEFGGVIVSTDNYRDLLQENSSWRETIEKRLLMFTWVDDLLMFPQDPLGRNGPTLDDFLKFPDT